MQNKLIIFGCGGHAKSVADVVLNNDPTTEIVFVDENAKDNETILNFPVIKEYKINNENVFVAIGDNKKRAETGEKYYNNLISIISKTAYIGKEVEIGKGVFVAHCAHVGIFSELKDFSIVNTSVSIDHECVLEKGASIAPNATLCGKAEIGAFSFIGSGATIIDKIKICENTTIGAGSTVIKDISKEGCYVGCPAKEVLCQ